MQSQAFVRHGSYLLADIIAVYRDLPLPAQCQKELQPGEFAAPQHESPGARRPPTVSGRSAAGVHALLGVLTEVEVQAVHASSSSFGRRLLKDLLASYEASFTKGKKT